MKQREVKRRRNSYPVRIVSLLLAMSILPGCGSQTSGDEAAGVPSDETASSSRAERSLRDWMSDKLYNQELIDEKEQARWTQKVTEDEFHAVWSDLAAERIAELGTTEIPGSIKSLRSLQRMQEIYTSVYGQSENLQDFSDQLDTYAYAAEALNEISSRYSVSLDQLEYGVQSNSFYILKRLETVYDDTLAGAVNKEIDGLLPEDGSDWLAANVTIFSDNGLCGDEAFVIHSNEYAPFPEQGIYQISYVDNGETMPLIDENGFQQDAPLYQMIGDTSQLDQDLAAHSELRSTCEQSWIAIRALLAPDTFDYMKKEPDTVLDFSGQYETEFGEVRTLTVFDQAAQALLDEQVRFLYDIGQIWTDNSGGYTMYLLGRNLYLAISDEGVIATVGVWQEDGQTMIHFYGPGYEEFWSPISE